MPAPPARIRSARVPCGLSSTATSPASICCSRSGLPPTKLQTTRATWRCCNRIARPLPLVAAVVRHDRQTAGPTRRDRGDAGLRIAAQPEAADRDRAPSARSCSAAAALAYSLLGHGRRCSGSRRPLGYRRPPPWIARSPHGSPASPCSSPPAAILPPPGDDGEHRRGVHPATSPNRPAGWPDHHRPATDSGEAGSGEASDSDSTGAPRLRPLPDAIVERGYFTIADSPRSDVQLADCGEDRWYFAAPSESTVEITLTRTGGAPSRPRSSPTPTTRPPTSGRADRHPADVSDALPATIRDLPGPALRRVRPPRRSDADDARRHLRPRRSAASSAASARRPASRSCSCTAGPAGTPSARSPTSTTSPTSSPSSATRSTSSASTRTTAQTSAPASSRDEIDETLAQWRARKVDLHRPQSGRHRRPRPSISTYGYGDRVSALMTIASPHRGTYIADAALGLAPGAVEDVAGAPPQLRRRRHGPGAVRRDRLVRVAERAVHGQASSTRKTPTTPASSTSRTPAAPATPSTSSTPR
jgi:hypothetical protein